MKTFFSRDFRKVCPGANATNIIIFFITCPCTLLVIHSCHSFRFANKTIISTTPAAPLLPVAFAPPPSTVVPPTITHPTPLPRQISYPTLPTSTQPPTAPPATNSGE